MILSVTFVDLETGGFNPEFHDILEAAAIRTNIEDGKLNITDVYQANVESKKPVDPVVAKINGYDCSKKSIPLHKAMAGVFELMRGSWHAGSNPKFDESFLMKAADTLHWEYPKLASYHLLDVSTLAFPLLINQKVERLRQHDISEYYGLGKCEHRAFADAMQCLNLFAKINNLEVTDYKDLLGD